MNNSWTEEENNELLDAIEKGTNISHIIELTTAATKRSEASVRRRLVKLGYLRNCGQSFARRQGFVR